MCTVTIIPLQFAAQRGRRPSCGYRLVTNRDERRERPEARPPRWREVGDGHARALYPTDGAAGGLEMGGGTWVAVTERGLTMCLLNGNPRPYPALPAAEKLVSRGVIIPSLVAEGVVSPEGAAETVRGMELEAFAPFTLLAAGATRDGDGEGGIKVVRIAWDREKLTCLVLPPIPLCEVSSGLGDERVRPRVGLFEALMGEHGPRAEVQDRFHRHTWSERPEISVMMRRSDARTVSVTTVEVVLPAPGMVEERGGGARVSMRYQPVVEAGSLGAAARAVIWRTGAAAATAASLVIAGTGMVG